MSSNVLIVCIVPKLSKTLLFTLKQIMLIIQVSRALSVARLVLLEMLFASTWLDTIQ
jgi:hypothetical protein